MKQLCDVKIIPYKGGYIKVIKMGHMSISSWIDENEITQKERELLKIQTVR
jgi:hypothetical protein